ARGRRVPARLALDIVRPVQRGSPSADGRALRSRRVVRADRTAGPRRRGPGPRGGVQSGRFGAGQRRRRRGRPPVEGRGREGRGGGRGGGAGGAGRGASGGAGGGGRPGPVGGGQSGRFAAGRRRGRRRGPAVGGGGGGGAGGSGGACRLGAVGGVQSGRFAV